MTNIYLMAAQRMAWSVITSSSTILVVFLPLLFWRGFVLHIMKYIYANYVVGSFKYIYCYGFGFCARYCWICLKPPTNVHTEEAFSDNSGFMQLYKKVLDWTLASPKRTIKIAITVLVVVKLVHRCFGKGVEFFPGCRA